jgi:hypothetical protein
MKFIKFSQSLKSAFVLVILAFMWGCGGGGGSTPNDVVSTVASVSVVRSSNTEYVIQGNNLVGVAAVELVVSYDSTTLSSPTVTNGGLFPGALFAANPQFTPSSIKIAFVSATDMSGTGQLAKISFASATGSGTVSIVSANTINSKSEQVPVTF